MFCIVAIDGSVIVYRPGLHPAGSCSWGKVEDIEDGRNGVTLVLTFKTAGDAIVWLEQKGPGDESHIGIYNGPCGIVATSDFQGTFIPF